MEDDELKNLFLDFDPELPSDDMKFMAELHKSMNAVELVKRQNAELCRRNKQAVWIAAAVGFVVGVLLTLAMPYIGDFVSTINITIPVIGQVVPISVVVKCRIVAWMVICGLSVIIALNAYAVLLARLNRGYEMKPDFQ